MYNTKLLWLYYLLFHSCFLISISLNMPTSCCTAGCGRYEVSDEQSLPILRHFRVAGGVVLVAEVSMLAVAVGWSLKGCKKH